MCFDASKKSSKDEKIKIKNKLRKEEIEQKNEKKECSLVKTW